MFHTALVVLLPAVAYAQISIRVEGGSSREESRIHHTDSKSKMLYTALLLLPAVAYAQISIRVVAGPTVEESHVHTTGKYADDISENEIQVWKIDKKECLIDELSTTALDSCVAGNGSIGTVKRILEITTANFQISYETVLLDMLEFSNDDYGYPLPTMPYNARLYQPGMDYASTTWITDSELTVYKDIRYKFIILDSGRHMSFTGPWGRDKAVGQTWTIGEGPDVPIELKYKQKAYSYLTATRGRMEVQVNFTATLDGMVTCNDGNEITLDVNECLFKGNKRRSVDSTVLINYVFYKDSKNVIII